MYNPLYLLDTRYTDCQDESRPLTKAAPGSLSDEAAIASVLRMSTADLRERLKRERQKPDYKLKWSPYGRLEKPTKQSPAEAVKANSAIVTSVQGENAAKATGVLLAKLAKVRAIYAALGLTPEAAEIAMKRIQAAQAIKAEPVRAPTKRGMSDTEIAAYLDLTVDEVRAMRAAKLKKSNPD
jgi:hypothetical protein